MRLARGPIPMAPRWPYYRAVALDLDGTIASGGPPEDRVLAAIAAARASGIRVVLVTGRILAELDAAFPGLTGNFDAVCAENGAVLARSGVLRVLARPLDRRLERRMSGEGVAVRAGEVLLACAAEAAHVAVDAIHELQLDAQLVRNRSELMILPAGVTKASGVIHTLDELRISPHSTVAVGDAENDHALLEACELGVAVANAVEALKERADFTLSAPNGVGVAELLNQLSTAGAVGTRPVRRRLRLGIDEHGRPVTLPASQTTVLVTGGPGAGKSYMAGSLAEQLIGLGYTVVVIDPEGDHTELGSLHNVLVFGNGTSLPSPPELDQFVRHDTSIVVDLSLLSASMTASYGTELMCQLEQHRRRTGLPHWIVLDEAHQIVGAGGRSGGLRVGAGYCLATYQPEALDRGIAEDMEWRLTMAGPPPGGALLRGRDDVGFPSRFTVAGRNIGHVRHQHKYTDTDLPRDRGFHFRDDSGHTGSVAVNLHQFAEHLRHCDPNEIHHHAGGRDMSRWIREVHRDPFLADRLSRLESRVAAGGDLRAARTEIVDAITQRYGLADGAARTQRAHAS